MQDGKLHLKDDKALNRFNKQARKAKSDEEIPGAFDEIESLNKKLAKLEKAQKDDHKLFFGKCEEVKILSDKLLVTLASVDRLEKRVETLEKLYCQTNNLAIANKGEIEELKRSIKLCQKM